MILSLILLQTGICSAQQPREVPHFFTNHTVPPEWERLISAGKNLTLFYKNVSRSYGPGHEIVRTAMIYLDEIEKLEEAVLLNLKGAMDAVWEIYLCGGPLHIKQIPYKEFIDTFNWNDEDISEYFTLIDGTRRIWNKLLEELERLAPPDLII